MIVTCCSCYASPGCVCNAVSSLQQPACFLGSPRVRSGHFNPLTATLKPQSNGPAYSNTVIGKLAVDVWAVTFGTARKAAARPGPSSLYQM